VSFHGRHEIVWMTPNFWTVVYIYIYVFIYIYVYIHIYIYVFIYIYIHICNLYTYLLTYLHTYLLTSLLTYILTYLYTYLLTYLKHRRSSFVRDSSYTFKFIVNIQNTLVNLTWDVQVQIIRIKMISSVFQGFKGGLDNHMTSSCCSVLAMKRYI